VIGRILALLALATLASPLPAQALSEEDYVGSLELVGFPFCPEGTTEVWGQLMSTDSWAIVTYLLGNRFGGDAAQKTLALPDLRHKAPLDGLRYCFVLDGTFPQQN
jgi:hypothetical protein